MNQPVPPPHSNFGKDSSKMSTKVQGLLKRLKAREQRSFEEKMAKWDLAVTDIMMMSSFTQSAQESPHMISSNLSTIGARQKSLISVAQPAATALDSSEPEDGYVKRLLP